MRYLDFLIREPVRSVLLHGAGIPVVVPAPERYAIHKLVVSTLRGGRDGSRSKATKDVAQAETLVVALRQSRQSADLGFAWAEAWDRGPAWRRRLTAGALKLGTEAFDPLSEGAVTAADLNARDSSSCGLADGLEGLVGRLPGSTRARGKVEPNRGRHATRAAVEKVLGARRRHGHVLARSHEAIRFHEEDAEASAFG